MEDISHILGPLNDRQREAVTAPPGPTLVIAGAGSGKTRVLVHRIAWLIEVERIPPWAILAVTFTNKAAREMRTRIESLLEFGISGMWVGTFHGLAHRLLRAHWQEAGLPKQFQIVDSEDQLRAIKRILAEMALDEDQWPARQVRGFINEQKEEGLRARHVDPGDNFRYAKLAEIYGEYERTCERGGLVDFAELLLRAHELIRERHDLRARYGERLQHLLVDEFQDTNAVQYAWLRLMASTHDHLFLVGDDDQSIYGWRGARVENILDFERDYADTRVIRLEQNYRSTGTILDAANAVIIHNTGRLGKSLWTEGGRGEPIRIYGAFNDVDEARFVVAQIRDHLLDGHSRSECAILYRTTAQSRLFEEALLQADIPYKIYGGLRFFERAEIKDAMAYLRLIANPADDVSFERVLNMPPRGIGARTRDAIRVHAAGSGRSLWQTMEEMIATKRPSARAAGALDEFRTFIEARRAEAEALDLSDLAASVIAESGLENHYENSTDGRGDERIENLAELVNVTHRFAVANDDEQVFESFIAHSALESGDVVDEGDDERVQLMTLHSAKGLEFKIVFVAGLEDGLFPHSLSIDDLGRLEEERRLCYVGITRARERLYLTHAGSRHWRGEAQHQTPSRFLDELPAELCEELGRGVRRRGRTARPAGGALEIGQRVLHPKFGEGVVLQSEGSGGSARVQVNFDEAGSKWLVLSYARLSAL